MWTLNKTSLRAQDCLDTSYATLSAFPECCGKQTSREPAEQCLSQVAVVNSWLWTTIICFSYYECLSYSPATVLIWATVKCFFLFPLCHPTTTTAAFFFIIFFFKVDGNPRVCSWIFHFLIQEVELAPYTPIF